MVTIIGGTLKMTVLATHRSQAPESEEDSIANLHSYQPVRSIGIH
jgi:hypothetical protein